MPDVAVPMNPVLRPEYATLLRKLVVAYEGGIVTGEELALFLAIATMADQLFTFHRGTFVPRPCPKS